MNEKSQILRTDIEGDSPGRMLALTDGLFATVLTVLVLDLRLPELASSASNSQIGQVLAQLWPHIFSYVLTFMVTGIYWQAHHRYFNHVLRHDRRLLRLNLSFLLFIGLLPFTTAVLSSHGPIPLFWTLYAANQIACGLTLTLTWGYAMSHGLVDADQPPQTLHYTSGRLLVMPAVFMVSIPIAFLTPGTYLGMFFLLVLPLLERVLDRRIQRGETARLTARQVWRERLWGVAAMLPFLILIGLGLWAIAFSRP